MNNNEVMNINKQEISLNNIASVMGQVLDKIGGIEDDVKQLKKKSSQLGRDVVEIKEEYPLDPAMADDIQKAVKKKVFKVIGGPKSGAYNDKALRSKVYMDIWREMKREFGLINEKNCQINYKKLKKKFYEPALECIENYELPGALEQEVMEANELAELEKFPTEDD